MAILISDKIGRKAKIYKSKEGHFTMIKKSIHQEEITSINICIEQQSPKIPEAKTDRIGRKIDNLTIIVGDFNTPFSIVDRHHTEAKQGHRRHEHTIKQLDLEDI